MKTPTRSFLMILAFTGIISSVASAQNNTLILNGGFIKLNGGTSSTRIFLVVNQNNIAGISRSSGHIISEGQYNYVRWSAGTSTGSHVIPFGYSTTDYIPVTINKTTVASSSFDASTWATNSQNLPHAGVSGNGTIPASNKMTGIGDSVSSVVDRWWDMYSTSAMTSNVTLSYRGAENSTTTNSSDNIDVQRWNGSSWDAPFSGSSTGVTSGIGTTTVTGVTAFAPMILVHRLGTLPVTITQFNSQCTAEGTKIHWQTATEMNSDYFSVERSYDGQQFQSIAKVKAAGESKVLKDYEIIDYSFSGNSVYYRLKEVDFDEKTSFTETIHSSCESQTEIVGIFPNPAIDHINYALNAQIKGPVTIEIHNQAGQYVMQEKFNSNDNTLPSTDVSQLSEGFYYVKVRYENTMFLTKFIKLKK